MTSGFPKWSTTTFTPAEAGCHIFELRHLVRCDVEVEDSAEPLGFFPERIIFCRVEPGLVRVVDRT